MAKLGTLTLGGGSGRSYAFEIYPWGTTFNPVAAVYTVTKRVAANDGNYTHTVLYVGETGDLSTRLDSHHKADAFARHNANCINILQERNADSRLHIEADLIAQHDPPCNGYAWKLTIRNDAETDARFDATIEFQDKDGFVIDSARESHLAVPAQSERTFTGYTLVSVPGATRVARTNAKVAPR